MKTIKRTIGAVLTVLILSASAYAQKATVGILNIDTKGVLLDPVAMSNLVRLEIEKTNVYNVLDKYDQADIIAQNDLNIANCYGMTCVVNAGKLFKVDKMLAGSVERFGEKIVISLRLIDVKTAVVEKTNTTEYLNLQQEIQRMVEVSVKKLLGIENDPIVVNTLVNYEQPITVTKTTMRANGPRMGLAYVAGDNGQRIQDSESQKGFEMLPVVSQFGYQSEVRYMSAGNFQALVEFIFIVSGMEQGAFIPSVTFMNGFRSSKTGWEIGFGPSIRISKTSEGFFEDYNSKDSPLAGNNGKWHRKSDAVLDNNSGSLTYNGNPVDIITRLDSKGHPEFGSDWVWAIGKTFQSGYLNIPVNIYISPRRAGWFIGASFGFNLANRTKK